MDNKPHLSAKTLRKHPPKLYYMHAMTDGPTPVYYDQYYAFKAGEIIKVYVNGHEKFRYEVFVYTSSGVKTAQSKMHYDSVSEAVISMSSMLGKLPQIMHPDVYAMYKKAKRIEDTPSYSSSNRARK